MESEEEATWEKKNRDKVPASFCNRNGILSIIVNSK